MPKTRRSPTSALLLSALAVAGCLAGGAGCGGGEQEGWAVRRFKEGDATHEAVRRDLVGPCSVIHVVDGDTLDVECRAFTDQVRMLRIDTPETGQHGHSEARRALLELVEGREVHLLFEEKGVRQRGNYGRLLAYVYADGNNVNVEMVRRGWSTFWTEFGEGRFAGAFTAAEQEAKAAKRGLWARR